MSPRLLLPPLVALIFGLWGVYASAPPVFARRLLGLLEEVRHPGYRAQ